MEEENDTFKELNDELFELLAVSSEFSNDQDVNISLPGVESADLSNVKNLNPAITNEYTYRQVQRENNVKFSRLRNTHRYSSSSTVASHSSSSTSTSCSTLSDRPNVCCNYQNDHGPMLVDGPNVIDRDCSFSQSDYNSERSRFNSLSDTFSNNFESLLVMRSKPRVEKSNFIPSFTAHNEHEKKSKKNVRRRESDSNSFILPIGKCHHEPQCKLKLSKANTWTNVEEIFLVGVVFDRFFKRGSLSEKKKSIKCVDAAGENGSECWLNLKKEYESQLATFAQANKQCFDYQTRSVTALTRHYKVMKSRITNEDISFREYFDEYERLKSKDMKKDTKNCQCADHIIKRLKFRHRSYSYPEIPIKTELQKAQNESNAERRASSHISIKRRKLTERIDGS